MNKSAEIRRLLNLKMKPKAIAKKLKTNVNLVYQVGWAMRKDKKQTPVYKKPKEDPKAKAWAKNNSWFGVDAKKTAYALGLHEELVDKGIDPKSDEYYKRINEGMKTFNKPKKPLTTTQKAIAKKLGLTQKQYPRIVKDTVAVDDAGKMKEGTNIGGLTLRKLPNNMWTWKKETKDDLVNKPKITRKELLNELMPGIDACFGLDAKAPATDLVNKPSHYTGGGIDFLDYAEAKGLTENAYLFNVVKYVSRAGKKVGVDPVQDLEKAEFYLKREIARRKKA